MNISKKKPLNLDVIFVSSENGNDIPESIVKPIIIYGRLNFQNILMLLFLWGFLIAFWDFFWYQYAANSTAGLSAQLSRMQPLEQGNSITSFIIARTFIVGVQSQN